MIEVRPYRERFEAELAAVALPDMALVERSSHTPPPLGDIAAAVARALREVELPRGQVAIAVGSRGIARVGEFVAALVAALKAHGAEPFIVPAMGSHGGATAAGQTEVLAHLGVTEATAGCPIRASMETVPVGRLSNGVEVFVDALALQADAIIPVNRIKPHTSFRGEYESGLAKMLAIGLGKQDGARSIHSLGWGGLRHNVPDAALLVLATGKIAFGLAILENAEEAPCRVVALAPNQILQREPQLLREAMTNLARLPFERIDVLVVDRVGKNVSGSNADPNVTGRFPSEFIHGGPAVGRLVFLAFTDASDGNGNGVGLADVVSAELAARYDPLPTYLNVLTTTAADEARLPMVMPTKELAVKAALQMCAGLSPAEAVVVRILDTLHLGRIWVSRPALASIGEPVATVRDFAPFTLADYA